MMNTQTHLDDTAPQRITRLPFERLVHERFSARSFTDRRVEPQVLERLKEITRMAPTSMNAQPWMVRVVESEALKEALGPVSFGQPQVTTCSHLFVFCANVDVAPLVTRLDERLRLTDMPRESIEAYISNISGYLSAMDAVEIRGWAQRQTFLALANAIHGAHALGLDACPMEGFEPEGYRRVLDLPDHLEPTVILAVGYADSPPRPKVRFETDELFF